MHYGVNTNPSPQTGTGNTPISINWLHSKAPQILLVMILWLSALAVPYQVFLYRNDFKNYYQLKTQQESLNIEYNQLLLEQQTFGSTPTIGSRALKLGMSPPDANKIVTLSIAPSTKHQNTQANSTSSPSVTDNE